MKDSLADWGWGSFFSTQRPDLAANEHPARVTAVHRDRIEIQNPDFSTSVPPVGRRGDAESYATIGDWVIYNENAARAFGPLTRFSLLKRRAAGRRKSQIQLIAANIDTLFIAVSANQDFNIPRIERYLSLAYGAGVTPVLTITKTDLATDLGAIQTALGALDNDLATVFVNSRSTESREAFAPWLQRGHTLAMVGSSGVGKSTLINTLSGIDYAATTSIRGGDDKGRHTTTHREMYQLPSGAWIIDTPGMREIQLADNDEGVGAVFDDLVELAAQCRFSDCKHQTEPGCAIRAALEAGEIDRDRYERWLKLQEEEALNTMTIVERRGRDKAFGKMVNAAMYNKRKRQRR